MIDVLWVCALKDEYDQARSVENGLLDPGWVESTGPRGWIVADGRFEVARGAPLHIRTTWATQMGREQAQAVASALIRSEPARCLAMSGICAGRRDKVSLGDVIFAERLWSYDAGKSTFEDGERRFRGDALQFRPPAPWVQRMQRLFVPNDAPWLSARPSLPLELQEDWALLRCLANEDPRAHSDFSRACPDWAVVLARLWDRKWLNRDQLTLTDAGRDRATRLSLLYPESIPAPPGFRIHVAPIATGAEVTEDEGIFPRLAASMRQVLGVEMEASALGALAEAHNVPILVAKGVSDFGDRFKDDRYRHFAARAAAECLIEVLRGSVDLLPELEGAMTGGRNLPSTSTRAVSYPPTGSTDLEMPRDLIDVLAEHYPEVRHARALWQRAGGKLSEVENIDRPRDLWQHLWRRSMKGASVRPINLLKSALDDLPQNAVLLYYLQLVRD